MRKFICLVCLYLCLCSFNEDSVRIELKKIYTKEIGVRELSGRNDGARVQQYLASVGLKGNFSWCAAFVTWCYKQAGLGKFVKANGWADSYFPDAKLVYTRQQGRIDGRIAKTGDLIGFYFSRQNRISHIGILDSMNDKYAITVEGNTNDAGSREGDGVYKKIRPKRTIGKIANVISL